MALGILGYAILWIGSSIAMKLLTPRVRGPSSGATDPEVEVSGNEGDPIPVVFGTCRIQPKVTWWGDVKKVPVKEQVQAAGAFNIAHYVTVANDHHVGMQMVICMGPIDELIDIVVDSDISMADQPQARKVITTITGIIGQNDVPVFGPLLDPITPAVPLTNPGTNVPTLLDVYAPNILGGDKNGGGIIGDFRFYWGNDPQDANAYLSAKISADADAIANTGPIISLPKWNRVCYAVSEQANMGEHTNIRPLQFVVKRCPKILSTTAEGIALNLDTLPYYDINGDANPAEVILEVLTDQLYGVGVTANYDLEMFAEAALYLHLEGMGISASLQRKGSAKEFIEEVLRHIDGILTQDPLTGLVGLKLQRPYSDPVTQAVSIPEATLTEDNVRLAEVVYPAFRSSVNEVKLTFTNRDRMFQRDVAQAQELALMEMANGDIISETYEYPMFTSHEMAQKKAFQILRQLRGPHQIRVFADRSFAHIGTGSLLLVDMPQRRLFNMLFRATRVDSGTMTDGEIEIEAIEDVFSVITAPYSTPSGGGGQPPVFTAAHKVPKVTVHQQQNFPAGTVIPGYGVDPGGTIGMVELNVRDPSQVVTDIEFWKQTGHQPRTGPVAFNMANFATDVPSEFVVLDPVYESMIWWRVTYTDIDGNPAIIEGTVTFGKTDALTTTDVTLFAEIVDFGDSATLASGCAGFQRLWNVKLTVTPIYPAEHYRWAPDSTPPVSQAAVAAAAIDDGGFSLGGIDELVFAANQDTINCREVPPFAFQVGVLTSNQYDEMAPTMTVWNIAYDGYGGFLMQQVPIGTPHLLVTGILQGAPSGITFTGTPITLNPASPVGTLVPVDEGPTEFEAVGVNDAEYLVKTAHAKLTAERVVTDTARIAWDWATAGQAKADIVAGSIGPTQLEATAVTPGTYGDATHAPQLTIDADGRITNATEALITGGVGYIQSPDAIDDPINDNFAGVSGALDTSGTGNRFTGSTPWTWDSQGSATATILREKLRLAIAASVSGHHIVWQAVPSGDWIIRCRLGWPISLLNSTKAGGLILKDSAGGKIEFFGWGISPTGIIWAAKYTNVTTFSATRTSLAQTTQYLAPRYLEIEKTSTDYIYRFGNDEAGMIQLISFAHTNFLDNAADRIGLSVLSENAAGSSAVIDVEEFFRVA